MIYNRAVAEFEARELEAKAMSAPLSVEAAHIGKSVTIQGELSGSENLYVDGNVEGKIELRDHMLTVGPSGHVKATVTAKAVVIHGKLEGAINATDRVDLRKSAVVTSDVTHATNLHRRRCVSQRESRYPERDWEGGSGIIVSIALKYVAILTGPTAACYGPVFHLFLIME